MGDNESLNYQCVSENFRDARTVKQVVNHDKLIEENEDIWLKGSHINII